MIERTTRQDRARRPDLRTTWFVCAPHRTSLARPNRPFGLRHATRAGTRYTACGIPTLGWATFWDQPFQVADDGVCRACLDVVLGDMRRAAELARRRRASSVPR